MGYLELELPLLQKPRSNGKTLLVWGGSSSVGSNAIQLAVASGYEVITTASMKNLEYVKSLGAGVAIDYNAPNVVSQLVKAVQGKDFVRC